MAADEAITTGRRTSPSAARAVVDDLDALRRRRGGDRWDAVIDEIGTVGAVGSGVAHVSGLPGVGVDEVVRFARGSSGLATDLGEAEVGVVLLDAPNEVSAGDRVTRTRRVLDVPVGEGMLGRVVDPVGRTLDGAGALRARERLPIERPAPPILDRAPVVTPLRTGIKVVDALFPIGRGQRELVLGDRQTGKTTLALTTVLAQAQTGVRCVVCAIGQRAAAIARWLGDLRDRGALAYTTVVVAASHDPPGLRYVALGRPTV